MNLNNVLQSITAWQKLSLLTLKPSLAYTILKYGKLVSEEADIGFQQRNAIIKELGLTDDVTEDDPRLKEFTAKYQEFILTEISLEQIDISFEEFIEAVDERGGEFSVKELSLLEPFFSQG